MVTPDSLRHFCARKVTLGASPSRLSGNARSKKMTLLLANFPQVFIEIADKLKVVQELTDRRVNFNINPSMFCISLRQNICPLEEIIDILKKYSITPYLVEHGLKDKRFSYLFSKISIIDCIDNRFDFGFNFATNGIRLYQTRPNDFPMLTLMDYGSVKVNGYL